MCDGNIACVHSKPMCNKNINHYVQSLWYIVHDHRGAVCPIPSQLGFPANWRMASGLEAALSD